MLEGGIYGHQIQRPVAFAAVNPTLIGLLLALAGLGLGIAVLAVVCKAAYARMTRDGILEGREGASGRRES